MTPLRLISCCLLCLVCSSAFATKVYTWKDEKGITHYGERPPLNTDVRQVKTRAGYTTEDATASASSSSAPSLASAAQELSRQVDAERCAAARYNLQVLTQGSRIRVPDESGEIRFLGDDEKAQKIAEMEQIINDSCV